MPVTEEYAEKYNRLWNSYFFPGTNTLKNKLNITNPDELKTREAEITFEKLVELYENPIKGSFDKEHWKAIHRYLFSDIYDWAGEYRYINMRKETDFTDSHNIDATLTYELNLMQEEFRQVTSIYSFATFLATYYVNLMAIHPFREGNGRSCREFLREFVAEKSKLLPCGPLELDWTKFDGEVVLANVQVSLVFRSVIENEFLKALQPLSQEIKM